MRAVRKIRSDRRGQTGFSLLELMVVVLIISILAIIAIPSMSGARLDRNAYDDAGYVVELFRAARTRSLARGAAVVVHLRSDTTNGQRGRFELWEGVTSDPNASAGGGAGSTAFMPVSACKPPKTWNSIKTFTGDPPMPSTGDDAVFIDAVDMNGKIEGQASIGSTVTDSNGNATTDLYLCFTPLGRVYQSTAASFDGALPMNGVVQVQVFRYDTTPSTRVGLTRTIVVPSSGPARMISS